MKVFNPDIHYWPSESEITWQIDHDGVSSVVRRNQGQLDVSKCMDNCGCWAGQPRTIKQCACDPDFETDEPCGEHCVCVEEMK